MQVIQTKTETEQCLRAFNHEASSALPLPTIEEAPPDAALALKFAQAADNLRWLNEHAAELEIFTRHRGKHLAVAGGELFIADSASEALRLARERHSQDCPHLRYIPQEKVSRVYAN
ncbi:MAG: hypothetical protein HOP19_23635 [Acidobacteria bacterium]|nr:hypothetical protein [Acidobacteriota bacterium]